jgi:hypothetical protein
MVLQRQTSRGQQRAWKWSKKEQERLAHEMELKNMSPDLDGRVRCWANLSDGRSLAALTGRLEDGVDPQV